MKKIILRLASVTYAMKASRLLNRNKIKARVVKLSDIVADGGCGYGVEIYEGELYSAAAILRAQDIEYSIYDNK